MTHSPWIITHSWRMWPCILPEKQSGHCSAQQGHGGEHICYCYKI